MTPNEYQALAMRTKADPAKILARLNEFGPAYLQAWLATNGLTNEIGEIADILKAAIEYGRGPVDKTHVKEEIGDAVWRLCQLADAFGLTLEECLLSNLNKLQSKKEGRYKEGEFSEVATNNRDLHAERNALESPHAATPALDGGVIAETKWRDLQNLQTFIPGKVMRVGDPKDPGSCFIHGSGPLTSTKSSGTLQDQKAFVTLCQIPIGGQRVVTECHEIGDIVFSPVNGAGFAKPPEIDETVEYPLDSEGNLDTKGWTFGIPTEPGNYEWFSPIHSLNPRKAVVHRDYNGNPGSWGRKVYWRKVGLEVYPGWTFSIPHETGRYEWFYSYEPFNYRVSLIEVENYSFTSVEVYFRKLS